jgi:hypothetical protein
LVNVLITFVIACPVVTGFEVAAAGGAEGVPE